MPKGKKGKKDELVEPEHDKTWERVCWIVVWVATETGQCRILHVSCHTGRPKPAMDSGTNNSPRRVRLANLGSSSGTHPARM